MQLHPITAVLFNLVLIQEVAAIAAVDTLDNTARAKCEVKPQICQTQNDCSLIYTNAHAVCKAVCDNSASAVCCDVQLYCWHGSTFVTRLV
ncbi:Arginine permease [Venturia inaequalis]|nr:Arginine permease [Venturia inaequalis]